MLCGKGSARINEGTRLCRHEGQCGHHHVAMIAYKTKTDRVSIFLEFTTSQCLLAHSQVSSSQRYTASRNNRASEDTATLEFYAIPARQDMKH